MNLSDTQNLNDPSTYANVYIKKNTQGLLY